MRKSLSFLAAALLTTAAAADPITYLGVGAGYQTSPSYGGLLGQFMMGYGNVIGYEPERRYYTGVELWGGVPSVPTRGEQNNRILWDIGASFLPGIYLFQDYLLYGRIGIQTINLKKPDAYKTASHLGLGMFFPLNPCLSLRAEYVYFAQGIVNHFLQLQTHNFNFAVIYTLDGV